ncbi:MAG: zf-HC2 domain-containing protein [Acidobacteriota bacterium]
MTCREFAEFIDSFIGGGLSNDEAQEFHRHLAVCSDCVNYIDTYRRTIAMSKRAFESMPEASVPEDVPEDLVKAILASRKP